MITAEEIYNDFYFNYKGDGNVILETMKEFTKLHVAAALEAVTEEVKVNEEYSYDIYDNSILTAKIDKNSILNAYPLNNIK